MAIGWKDMGDLSLIQADRDAFKEKYTEVYPDTKKGSIANGAGMLYRFAHEVEIGDYVVFPSKIDRQINIGVIEGVNIIEYVQQHKVKWLKYLPRTSFSQGALYEVGSAMSFCTVKNYADEYLAALDKGFKKNAMVSGADEDESVGATADEIIEATIQSLKGAMREGDYGLFVTLSYTKNAQKYLDSTPIIRGINGTELVDLILKYYHDLSDTYKKMILLKRVYIPVAKDEQA